MRHSDLKRIGVIGPAANMALEWELPRHLPAGYAINYNRVHRPGGALLTRESLLAMGEAVDAAARDLIRAEPQAILYGCTSGSFIDGFGNEAGVADRITAATGIPAITTSSAVIGALQALGARSVFMVTPYPEDINRHEADFLRFHGFRLTGYDSFRCDEVRTIASVDSRETAAMVLANRPAVDEADAVFVSCTNLLTFDQIPYLERVLDKPVVSSNQASLWGVLRLAGAPTGHAGVGRLFDA